MSADNEILARCMELAYESMSRGDLPFGAVVTYNGHIIAEAHNTGKTDITGHAEVNALRKVIEHMTDVDITTCTLYSNFEPCAMCSYLIRDYGIQRVVFSVASPHLGGTSKWPILRDNIRPEFTMKHIAEAPEITHSNFNEECSELFDSLNWKMHRK